eukprot:CAMPEP_0167750252 /NCGR_PEP_ID=MMETSP0110_2-20121227/5883_1 /TAXON_ID=629695 /ORGANISM="Gymnochlora sp., Strain CCMP2014" /LENGTH=310 /DNA_ID=CAMNT_0007635543 /DNA_START=62 /DNA_END=991 /DNA_ORIENTATION=+
MDLNYMQFDILAVPRDGTTGLPKANKTYGFVGWVPRLGPIHVDRYVVGGMNEKGLSCDMQHLPNTVHPPKSKTLPNIAASQFCEWALSRFSSAEEVAEGMKSVNFIESILIKDQHFSVRDEVGHSLVIEWIDGNTNINIDHNDDGKTGYGIMTNQPPYQFHIENVKHMKFKQTCARTALAIPGSFYPDERYLRIFMFREGMPEPKTYREAVMQAVHVLNSITLPMGTQMGTDADGKSSEAGGTEYTLYGVIYDHKGKVLYYRTPGNQSLQRIRINDFDLSKGAKELKLHSESDLEWYVDVNAAFKTAMPM